MTMTQTQTQTADERGRTGRLMTTMPSTAVLERITVREAMHSGLITVAPDDSVGALAHAMAHHHVHCLLVEGVGEAGGGRSVWRIVSDLDLMRALKSGLDLTAANLAAGEVLTIDASRRLGEAVQLMVEHDLTHLVVVDGAHTEPIGVISTQDIARAAVTG